MSLEIIPPQQIFYDKDGSPLDAGFIYVGELSQNPETNQVAVYWDAAMTQPAPQPIRTLNGYVSRQGVMAKIYTDSSFSITVRNKRGELVFSSSFGNSNGNNYALLVFPDYATASAAAATLPDGQKIISENDDVSWDVESGALGAEQSVYKVADYAKIRNYLGRGTRLRVIDSTGAHWWVRRGAAPDNGGTVLKDASNRSWEREFSGVVNVQWFGATGNGSDEDTDAIRRALTAAKTGSLYLPAGVYLVRAPKAAAALTMPVEGVRIFGDGRFASTLVTDSDCVLIGATDANFIDIENLGFTGGRTAPLAWQRSIMLRGVVNARVKGCYFHKMGDNPIGFGTNGFGGSDAIPNGTRQCENLSIEDNLIVDCFGTLSILTKMIGTRDTIVRGNIIKNSSGISIESEGAAVGQFAERIIVSGNIVFNVDSFRASGSGSTAGGIGVGEYARIFVVSGNVIDGVRGDTLANGLDISTSPNQTDKSIDEFVIANNVVKNIVAVSGYGNGIGLKAGDASVKSMTIAGNQVANATVGISFEAAFGSKTLGEISSLSVSANNVANTSGIGMLFTLLGGSGDIPLKSSAFTGNTVTNAGGHGMSLKAVNSTITGNTVTGSAQTGLFTAVGSASLTISGNTFNENLQSGMALNGDHLTIVGNSTVNNGSSGVTSYGIHVQSGGFALIVNNNASDTRASTVQSYGVRAPNGSTIRENQLIGNVLGTVWGGIANHNTGTYDSGLNRIA